MNEASSAKTWGKATLGAIALVAFAVILAAVMLVASARRELSSLEGTLFQVLILATGLVGSYIVGKQSASEAAKELMKPAARSAFRRVLWLYGSLERLAQILGDQTMGDPLEVHRLSIARAVIKEQLTTASDAMEDWRDLVPRDVEDVERRLRVRSEASWEAAS